MTAMLYEGHLRAHRLDPVGLANQVLRRSGLIDCLDGRLVVTRVKELNGPPPRRTPPFGFIRRRRRRAGMGVASLWRHVDLLLGDVDLHRGTQKPPHLSPGFARLHKPLLRPVDLGLSPFRLPRGAIQRGLRLQHFGDR